MKTSPRILASIALAALLVALQVAASFWFFTQVETTAALRKHTFETIDGANELLSALKDAETGQRGYLVTGDEAFLTPYLEVRDGIAGRLADLRKRDESGIGVGHLDAARPLIAAKMAEMSRVIDLSRNQDMAGARQMVAGGAGRRLMDSIRVEVGKFIDVEKATLAETDAALQSNMRSLLAVIIVASLFVLVFCVSLVYLIYLQSQQKLQNLVHSETQESLRRQGESNTQLQNAYEVLQDREEKLAVTLSSIGDGVIATDAEARVMVLNPVAEKLTGWSQAEAYGRPVGEIFNIVNKESRKAATIPVADALTHGTIQGLANHTVLIARDGAESDIADSCAPIRNRDGEVVGAVLVFRDVTEEYAVQIALRDSSALVQTVLNTVADGV
ncbi:MAG: CHASE3 domain-containing protein, partial [Arenimonas sp.]|nr:CHASE3 domain-containing protein [Arenimonas sp.]